jgi:hypothetical protein
VRWYPFDDCTFDARGLSTPALLDLPKTPIARPRADLPRSPAQQGVPPEVRRLLVQLATARAGRDLTQTRLLIRECDAILARKGYHQPTLAQARDAAQQWLQTHSRRIAKGGADQLTRAEIKDRARQEGARSRPSAASTAQAAKQARDRRRYLEQLQVALERGHFGDVRVLLAALRRLPAGRRAPDAEQALLTSARASVSDFRRLGELQERVPRRRWITEDCPRCRAVAGRDCYDALPGQQPLHRPGGHDERLRVALEHWRRGRGRRRSR